MVRTEGALNQKKAPKIPTVRSALSVHFNDFKRSGARLGHLTGCFHKHFISDLVVMRDTRSVLLRVAFIDGLLLLQFDASPISVKLDW